MMSQAPAHLFLNSTCLIARVTTFPRSRSASLQMLRKMATSTMPSALAFDLVAKCSVCHRDILPALHS
jgi:hypothetical protein